MSIKNNQGASRYELDTDGHLSIADYQLQDGNLVITHVEVPDALRGQGIAAKLMEGIVMDANVRQLKIVPVCSYAASYMQRPPKQ